MYVSCVPVCAVKKLTCINDHPCVHLMPLVLIRNIFVHALPQIHLQPLAHFLD